MRLIVHAWQAKALVPGGGRYGKFIPLTPSTYASTHAITVRPITTRTGWHCQTSWERALRATKQRLGCPKRFPETSARPGLQQHKADHGPRSTRTLAPQSGPVLRL